MVLFRPADLIRSGANLNAVAVFLSHTEHHLPPLAYIPSPSSSSFLQEETAYTFGAEGDKNLAMVWRLLPRMAPTANPLLTHWVSRSLQCSAYL